MILFTSAMSIKYPKGPTGAAVGHLLAAAGCVVISNVYSLFGHGVRSGAMDTMFLYPLCAAALFLLARLLRPGLHTRPLYRLTVNLLGSGVGALATGAMLKGILEIAGTATPYTAWFYLAGGVFSVLGLVLLALLLAAK